MIGLDCQLKDVPTTFLALLFNQLVTLIRNRVHQNGFSPLGCPHEMVHNQVYPVFVSLVAQSVVFHVDSIPYFDTLSNRHFWLKPGTLSSPAVKTAWLSRRLMP